MGFTHYFTRPLRLPKAKFEAVGKDTAVILDRIKKSGIKIAGPDGKGSPEITSDRIAFNGTSKGDLGHESFVLERKSMLCPWERDAGQKEKFAFCKTAHKPYDLAVCSALIVAKHHLGDSITVSSDGDMTKDEWLPAVKLVKETLGYGGDFSL